MAIMDVMEVEDNIIKNTFIEVIVGNQRALV